MNSNKVSDPGLMQSGGLSSRFSTVLIIAVSIISVATLAITIAIVVEVYKSEDSSTTRSKSFSGRIQIGEVMSHLNALQRIADSSNENRAVNTVGFNRTLDYIKSTLQKKTDFRVSTDSFTLRNFVISNNHTFITSINGVEKEWLYTASLATSNFSLVQYTRPIDITTFTQIVVIPNLGCDRDDWSFVPVTGNIVLVKRGVCTFLEKAAFARTLNARALMFYNYGNDSAGFPPILVNLGRDNELPALFLSFDLGSQLAEAAKDPTTNTGVKITLNIIDESTYPVDNVCADTPTGDPTKTIVVGAHSDSVSTGPGIDDNGSGSAAILAMATTLYSLYRDPEYKKYDYRVRFCWWGAEELGLLGSADHVNKASVSTTVGERLSDYLINLNFDMLGSSNFMFGIYDARTAPSSTPKNALPGSQKTTDLFVEWFESQSLPWDYTQFSGRSDYGPFLAQGIAAGGLFSGADETKTKEQRDRYAEKLGKLLGGIAQVIHDPCYHRPCDSMGNINEFALDKMIQAASFTLETMGQSPNLVDWLYPNGRVNIRDEKHVIYDPIAEYFNLPYS